VASSTSCSHIPRDSEGGAQEEAKHFVRQMRLCGADEMMVKAREQEQHASHTHRVLFDLFDLDLFMLVYTNH
jgi:hypothetical protein